MGHVFKKSSSLAAAGIAALVGATPAQAAIVTVVLNDTLPVGNYSYDLDGDGTDDLNIHEGKGQRYALESNFVPQTKAFPSTGLTTVLLDPGDAIPNGTTSADIILLDVNFDGDPISGPLYDPGGDAKTVFIGFRFEGSGTFYEAWLEFASSGSTASDLVFTFVRYGYGEVGDGITVPSAAVPLPGAGLLMLGGIAAFGFAGQRRRRRFQS